MKNIEFNENHIITCHDFTKKMQTSEPACSMVNEKVTPSDLRPQQLLHRNHPELVPAVE